MDIPERPRLLLVEDDRTLGPLIAELLGEDYSIHWASDGQQGLHHGLTGHWDVMVIDRGLPLLDGVGLISALRERGVGCPILILTALGTTEDKVHGLDAGANDYLTKPFEFAELAARLRALTRSYGPAASPAGSLSIGDWDFDPAARTLRSLYGQAVSLTGRESELLAALAREPERIFTRQELVAALFTPTDQPGIIDTYVHFLRRKIAKSIIRTVHGVGYQLGDPSA